MLISTERLGWPRWGLGLAQHRLQYEIEPERPTATCHLQPDEETEALCGHQWERLIAVPGQPAWGDLDEDLRCDQCEHEAKARA